MKCFNWILVSGVIFFSLSCETTMIAQKTNEEKEIIAVPEISIVNLIDTSRFKEELIDSIFLDRRIIYRDLSAIESLSTISGSIAVKVCINRAGLVTYIELYPDETSITDRQILKSFLKACRGYKFQPDVTAPKEQCGRLLFNIDN